ncbi:hypothetical protein PPACK8108_LOCUS14820 [Phakopsora pachyrhizi]|uniref:Uncharacterized protein n=1 Tax=Phakopsora pachyrhizi TaxID=170000 RepID=A0AAV0B708_PHAPC|nr:hypothetical protein PPACK8108_LOCUS14820 [Phakopsora pachyrhizi]
MNVTYNNNYEVKHNLVPKKPGLLETVTCKNIKGESQKLFKFQIHSPSGDQTAKGFFDSPASELTTPTHQKLKACSKAENKNLSTSENDQEEYSLPKNEKEF